MAKINRKTLFAGIKSLFSGGYNGEVGAGRIAGIDSLIDEWENRNDVTADQFAYIVATTIWETDYTVQPINEKGGDAYFTRMYDPTGKRPKVAARLGNDVAGDGIKYKGRGFVQLTGKRNYKLASEKLGIDLIAHPEKALDLKVATTILFDGMVEGWFTGKKLSTYINDNKCDFLNARRIINGVDKKEQIAAIANKVKASMSKAEVANQYPLKSSRTVQGAVATATASSVSLVNEVNKVVEATQGQQEALTSGNIVVIVIGVIAILGALYALYARWDDAGRPVFWR